jgi:pyruvate kinase
MYSRVFWSVRGGSLIVCCPCAGESANGKWPDTAVSTMASIVQTAELALDYGAQLDWIRVNK